MWLLSVDVLSKLCGTVFSIVVGNMNTSTCKCCSSGCAKLESYAGGFVLLCIISQRAITLADCVFCA